jgi:hypothetical protein
MRRHRRAAEAARGDITSPDYRSSAILSPITSQN